MEKIQLTFNPEFEEFLNDPGIQILIPGGGPAKLGDIHVFPELKNTGRISLSGETPGDEHISAKLLSDPDSLPRRVLISGVRDSGKTALLKILATYYARAGYEPLYIDLKETGGGTGSVSSLLTEEIYYGQYSGESAEIIEQSGGGKKIALIDNMDFGPIHRNQSVALPESVLGRFDKVIFTVEHPFDLSMNDFPESGQEPARLQIMEMGHELRRALIKKWQSLMKTGDGDDASGEHLLEAERIIDAVIVYGLVPSLPVFVLMILQTARSGTDTVSGISSYGYYYEHMIKDSLARITGERDLDVYLDYLSELAAHIDMEGNDTLGPEELSSRGSHLKDIGIPRPEAVMEVLTQSLTLREQRGRYTFRYSYIYYYFRARHISRHMESPEIKREIATMCTDLDKEENANILLFLTHHASDPAIIDEISRAMGKSDDKENTEEIERRMSEIDKLIDGLERMGAMGSKLKEIRAEYGAVLRAGKTLVQDMSDTSRRQAEVMRAVRGCVISGEALRALKAGDSGGNIYETASIVYSLWLSSLIRALEAIEQTVSDPVSISSEYSPETSAGQINKIELYDKYKAAFMYHLRLLPIVTGGFVDDIAAANNTCKTEEFFRAASRLFIIDPKGGDQGIADILKTTESNFARALLIEAILFREYLFGETDSD